MKTFAVTLLAAALLAAPAAFAQQYDDPKSTHSQHDSGTTASPATSSSPATTTSPSSTGMAERSDMASDLPATASPLPLLGLVSLVSLGSGLLLRLRRRG